MKIPKSITTYCPKCKEHTDHTASLYRAGKQRALSKGARRQARRKQGYGGQKFPELKRTAKTTKKQTLQLECKKCGYTLMKYGLRLRKLEVAA